VIWGCDLGCDVGDLSGQQPGRKAVMLWLPCGLPGEGASHASRGRVAPNSPVWKAAFIGSFQKKGPPHGHRGPTPRALATPAPCPAALPPLYAAIVAPGSQGIYTHTVSYEKDDACPVCSAGVLLHAPADATLQQVSVWVRAEIKRPPAPCLAPPARRAPGNPGRRCLLVLYHTPLPSCRNRPHAPPPQPFTPPSHPHAPGTLGPRPETHTHPSTQPPPPHPL
jgi:hypothetical protein